VASSTPAPDANPPSAGIAGLFHAAGHFFENLAAACRATVQSLEASAAALVKTETPQAQDTAARIEAVLADDVKTELGKDLPQVESAVEKTVEAAAPVILANAGQVAVKAVEAAL
jgi:hypothetical protein